MNDDRLIHGLRDRQTGAFQEVVAAHQRRIVNICYRFVQNEAEAEDLAQETFIEVYRSIDRFRGQSELSTWIYRIAVSKSLDFMRKKGREKRGGKLGVATGLDGQANEMPAPASAAPDKVLEQKERRRILQQALGTLSENQRVAFVLSQYDGLSYQDIAKIMKTSVPSVESLIHRARKNLRKILLHYYEQNQ